MKKLSIIVSVFLMIFLSSCDMNITEIERQHNLEYITVDTSDNVKLTYLIGETLKTTGIKVIGHYSDETEQEEEIRLVTFSELDNTKPSDSFPITVNYEGKEASYNVVILEAQVESISLQLPQKLFYQKNEQLDTTGLIVYGNYTNGVTLKLDESQYVIDSVDLSEYGSHWVYVRLASNINISEAYKIEVQDFTISSIEITSCPNRMIYMAGEELDLTGLVVTATTDKGRQTTLNKDQFTFSPASIKDLEPSEKVEITVNVNESKASFDIKIVPGYVVGAVITKKETKEQIQDSNIIYCEGENFKLEDYDFYELLSNETLGNLIGYDNLQCDINNIPFVGEGIHTVNIKYNFEDVASKEQTEYTIEMKVCVVDSELEKIEAKWSNKGGYPLGILPDNSNPEKYGEWEVKGVLKNGTDILIDSKCCEYKYNGEPLEQNIGDGLWHPVIVSYHDIRTGKVFSYSGTEGSPLKVLVVEPVLTKVVIKTYPKINYIEGQQIDLTGLNAKGVYSDNNEKDVKQISCEPQGNLTTEDTEITLIFPNDIKVYIPIIVENPKVNGISIFTVLAKLDSDGTYSFRRGKKYAQEDFKKLFTIKVNKDLGEGENIYTNIVFSLHEYEDNESKKCRVDVVYTNDQNTSYSASSLSHKILPALPKAVEIKQQENNEISSVDEYIKSLKLEVTYEDGTKTNNPLGINTDGKWSDDAGSYEVTLNEDNLKITFTANKTDVIENEFSKLEFDLPFIKGIKIKPTISNENFRYNRNYNYSNYYDVYMVFPGGIELRINTSENPPKITASFDKSTAKEKTETNGYLIGTYKIDDREYSCVYNGAEFYPAQPKEIKVYKNENVNDITSNEELISAHYYEITYEDESVYNSSNGGETNKERCLISYDFNRLEKVSITYAINNPFNCVEDKDNPQVTRDYTISRITAELSTYILTKENMTDEEKKEFVINNLKSLKCEYDYNSEDSITIDRKDKISGFSINIDNNNAEIFLSSNTTIIGSITLQEPSTSSEAQQ